jgi:hypothetical protein
MPTPRDDNAAEPMSGEPLKTIIKIENVSKVYRLGEQDVTALKNVILEVKRRQFHGDRRIVRERQVNAAQPHGVHRYAEQGAASLIDGQDVSGQTPDELAGLRARTIGFIFPDLQSAAGPVGRGERRVSAAADARSRPGRAARPRQLLHENGGAGQKTPATARTSCPADSVSGLRLPGRW